MTIRNLGWLIDRLKFKLNVNTGQTDQDFIGPSSDTNKWYRDLINEAGDKEFTDAKQEGHFAWFLATEDLTWESGEVTYDLPAVLQGANILMVRDVTNDEVGDELPWSSVAHSPGIYFKDFDTLQWDTSGPGQDTTVRFIYEARWRELTSDIDEPDYIPSDFRWLLVWSAVEIAKTIGDENVPKNFEAHLEGWRERYWKHISRGRPGIDNVARLLNRDGDYDVHYY